MKYVLTVTESQLQTISEAMEIFARLGIGQFEDAIRRIPEYYNVKNSYMIIEDIRGILTNYGVGGYHSMHNENIDESHRVAWDIYQVARHTLAWDQAVKDKIVESVDSPRKWPDMIQVSYDDPMVHSDEPLMIIERIKDANSE